MNHSQVCAVVPGAVKPGAGDREAWIGREGWQSLLRGVGDPGGFQPVTSEDLCKALLAPCGLLGLQSRGWEGEGWLWTSRWGEGALARRWE